MALVEDAMESYLTSVTEVTNKVDDRIYPVRRPQGAAHPHIVFSKVTGPRLRSHDGESGLANPRFQLDSYGATYKEARETGEEVRLAMLRFHGGPDVQVHAVFPGGDQDTFLTTSEDYRHRMDFTLWHTEAVH